MTVNAELKKKRLFLLDMDGTIYLDDVLFEYSSAFLDYVRHIGGKYIFLTNNSSKSVSDYIEKLQSLSIEVDESNFLTSSQATGRCLLERHKNSKIYVLGTQSFRKELRNSHLWITDRFEKDIDCLVVGFDTELTYGKLLDACRLLTEGVDYVATNPDLVCPTSFGFVPDCGSICHILEIATNRKPEFIGKPNSAMAELAIEAAGFSKEETIVLGDRLYTDIACGINAGISTGVVLTGETSIRDVENTEYKPDYVFQNIGEVYFRLTSK